MNYVKSLFSRFTKAAPPVPPISTIPQIQKEIFKVLLCRPIMDFFLNPILHNAFGVNPATCSWINAVFGFCVLYFCPEALIVSLFKAVEDTAERYLLVYCIYCSVRVGAVVVCMMPQLARSEIFRNILHFCKKYLEVDGNDINYPQMQNAGLPQSPQRMPPALLNAPIPNPEQSNSNGSGVFSTGFTPQVSVSRLGQPQGVPNGPPAAQQGLSPHHNPNETRSRMLRSGRTFGGSRTNTASARRRR